MKSRRDVQQDHGGSLVETHHSFFWIAHFSVEPKIRRVEPVDELARGFTVIAVMNQQAGVVQLHRDPRAADVD
jgi:hypothetical protein